ncbi:FAD binding domain-containing protein [Halanaerobaculum tunisiense]
MKKKYARNVKNKPDSFGKDFKRYFAPETIEEAVNILQEYGRKVTVLAGGTDLLVEYYDKLYDLDNILDLKNIQKLKEINVKEDWIEIGPLVTHTEIENSENLNNYFPVLSQAAADIGALQIRNRGTLGGNIVTASPAGDLLPPLLAYQAKFKLSSAKEEDIVLAEDFFTGPKKAVINPEQLLTKVIIPKPKLNTAGVWKKVGNRKALAISSLSLALVVEFNQNQVISDVRACMGAVAPTPLEIKAVKKQVIGKRIDQLAYEELGQLVADNMSPIDDIRGTEDYRREVGRDIMISALKELKWG